MKPSLSRMFKVFYSLYKINLLAFTKAPIYGKKQVNSVYLVGKKAKSHRDIINDISFNKKSKDKLQKGKSKERIYNELGLEPLVGRTRYRKLLFFYKMYLAYFTKCIIAQFILSHL